MLSDEHASAHTICSTNYPYTYPSGCLGRYIWTSRLCVTRIRLETVSKEPFSMQASNQNHPKSIQNLP